MVHTPATTAAARVPQARADRPLVRAFTAARRCSVPLVAVATPDPAATVAALLPSLTANGGAGPAPVVSWDLVRGLRSVNPPGAQALAAQGISGDATINPVEAFLQAAKLPQYAAVLCFNAHLQLRDPGVLQALWNLRDLYKQNRRTIILLGPSFAFPAELAGDVIVLDEPLPTRAELEPILDQLHVDADLPIPAGSARTHALDAVVGLPAFTAEQVIALSLEGPKSPAPGIHLPSLWTRKCKAIEATDGLRVWKGGETFDDLQGIDHVKGFMQKLVNADAFGVVVFLDELDKSLAGGMADYSGDSGVAKDQVGTLLSYIEDTGSLGVLLAGLAGTGKSALAKATGNAAGKVTIAFDLGGMKGGTVGQSERQIRAALKVVTATAEGRVLFIGTANNSTVFSPELNRRFADQFYFDNPDAAGRAAIWPVYIARCGLTPEQAARPASLDVGWTGAEIKRVCQRAQLFTCTVVEAAQYLVPNSVSAAATIARMREAAAGRFLSASRPGLYQAPTTVRALEVEVVVVPGVTGKRRTFES